jgi:methionine synthase II (cobalamin-independent)
MMAPWSEKTGQLPLFFTQVIGSLPRPQLVHDLMERKEQIEPARHRKLMDEMVLFAIRL